MPNARDRPIDVPSEGPSQPKKKREKKKPRTGRGHAVAGMCRRGPS